MNVGIHWKTTPRKIIDEEILGFSFSMSQYSRIRYATELRGSDHSFFGLALEFAGVSEEQNTSHTTQSCNCVHIEH